MKKKDPSSEGFAEIQLVNKTQFRSVYICLTWPVFFSDSENPADYQDPSFTLSKVHSASTLISNLSLVSASIDSDLDTRSKEIQSSNNDVRSVGSSGVKSKTKISSRSLKSESMRSVELNGGSRSTVGVKSEKTSQGLSHSQKLLSNGRNSNRSNLYSRLNGNISGNSKNLSSVVDRSRVSSIPAELSDSDVDSYSDIVGQPSWKDSSGNRKVDLSGSSRRRNSQSNQRVSVRSNSNTWNSVSDLNSKGGVISPPGQQWRVSENSANTAVQISGSPKKQDRELFTNETSARVSRLEGLERGTSRVGAQRKSWSGSPDVVNQNGSRAVTYNQSVPGKLETMSSDEDEKKYQKTRRWKSSTSITGDNHTITGTILHHSQKLKVSSVDSGVNTKSHGTANHADQFATEMGQARKKRSVPSYVDGSQSSQDSTDSMQTRQTAAERAAAALMNSHLTHAKRDPVIALTTRNIPHSEEMRETSSENRRLRREHLANRAHLQSSSC